MKTRICCSRRSINKASNAAALARSSDVAVVFAGDYETEGADRESALTNGINELRSACRTTTRQRQ